MWNRLSFNARFIVVAAGWGLVYGLIVASQRTVEDLLVLSLVILAPLGVIVTLRRGAARGIGWPGAILGAAGVLRSEEASTCIAIWLVVAACCGIALAVRDGLGGSWRSRPRGRDSGLVDVAVSNQAPEVRASDILAQLDLDDGRME